MTLEQTIKVLKEYQQWKKGLSEQHPAILGAAIDNAIDVLVEVHKS